MTVANFVRRITRRLSALLPWPVPDNVRLASAIRKHTNEANRQGSVTQDELAALCSSLQDVQDFRLVETPSKAYLRQAITQLWEADAPPRETIERLEKEAWERRRQIGIRCKYSIRGSYSLDIGWTFAMSESFVKCIKSADKKLQGRVLEAISKLCGSPVETIGDTVKPLTGNMSGLWRYRIGDYRLIYQPKLDMKVVVLLSFEGRGSVY